MMLVVPRVRSVRAMLVASACLLFICSAGCRYGDGSRDADSDQCEECCDCVCESETLRIDAPRCIDCPAECPDLCERYGFGELERVEPCTGGSGDGGADGG